MEILSARIKDKIIQVYVVGKWRNLRSYNREGIPSQKIQEEVIHSIWLNTGKRVPKEKIKLNWI